MKFSIVSTRNISKFDNYSRSRTPTREVMGKQAVTPFEGAEASASQDEEIKWRIYNSAAELVLGVSPVNLEDHDNLQPTTTTCSAHAYISGLIQKIRLHKLAEMGSRGRNPDRAHLLLFSFV
jgi:hypothetical protein